MTAAAGCKVAKRSPQLFDAQVGTKVKIARREGRLSQTELGRRLGVSAQQIKKYESGKTRIGASRLTQIAEALQVSLLRLLESAGVPEEARERSLEPADALVSKADALRLLRAFHEIGHSGVRLAVLQLIEAVAQMQEPQTHEPQAHRARQSRA